MQLKQDVKYFTTICRKDSGDATDLCSKKNILCQYTFSCIGVINVWGFLNSFENAIEEQI